MNITMNEDETKDSIQQTTTTTTTIQTSEEKEKIKPKIFSSKFDSNGVEK